MYSLNERPIIAMKQKYIQISSIVLVAVIGGFIVFLYATAPRSLEELSAKAKETVDNAVTKGQVLTGIYTANRVKVNQGIGQFRQEKYEIARELFNEADPEKRDGQTQFYIAYSFYREGWGKFANDDKLFEQAYEAGKRAQILLGENFVSDDADLKLKTTADLLAEIEEGLRVTPDDFNPQKWFRERK